MRGVWGARPAAIWYYYICLLIKTTSFRASLGALPIHPSHPTPISLTH